MAIKKPAPKKMGRPKTVIDLDQAEGLGRLGCTYAECAAFLNIPESTLKTHPDFSTAFKKGLEQMRMSQRRLNIKHAQTSVAMSIFLSKNYLGMRDNPEPEAQERAATIELIPKRMADED